MPDFSSYARPSFWTVLVLAAGLTLAACGGSNDAPPADTTTAPAPVASAPATPPAASDPAAPPPAASAPAAAPPVASDPPAPVNLTLQAAPPFALGQSHSCSLRPGTGAVACWGSQAKGQLGDGTAPAADALSTVAVAVVDAQGQTLSHIQAIAAGTDHSCAIAADNSVLCWGSDQKGQLGDGQTKVDTPHAVPVKGLSNVVALALGQSHSCALTQSAQVLCWGDNTLGQVTGKPSAAARTAPIAVALGLPAGVTPVAIAAGSAHTCAKTSDGNVTCWGSNDFGQLGFSTGNATTSKAPGQVTHLSNAGKLVLGGQSSCSVDPAQRVPLCWGKSLASGQASDVSELGQPVHPADRSLRQLLQSNESVVDMALGQDFACAVTDKGEVMCMGTDAHGELAIGSVSFQDPAQPLVLFPPSVVNALPQIAAVVSGPTSSDLCSITTEGVAFCWGDDSSGQTGNGQTGAAATPHKLSALNGTVF